MKFVKFQVEEHLGGRDGLGKGKRTGFYETKEAAIAAMVAAHNDGNGATCICRFANGAGTMYRLTRGNRLVKA